MSADFVHILSVSPFPRLLLSSSHFHSLSPSQQITTSDDTTVESSSLSLSQTNLSACGPSTRHESWTCALCTYLNKTKTSRCAQCSSKRDAVAEPSSNATNYDVQEQINALSIRDAPDPEVNATVNQTSPLDSNNLSGSRTNLGAVGTRFSPVEQQNKNQPASTKWWCLVIIIIIAIANSI